MGHGPVLDFRVTPTLAGENYSLSLHDALPIFLRNLGTLRTGPGGGLVQVAVDSPGPVNVDRGDLFMGDAHFDTPRSIGGMVAVGAGRTLTLTGPAFAVAGDVHAAGATIHVRSR